MTILFLFNIFHTTSHASLFQFVCELRTWFPLMETIKATPELRDSWVGATSLGSDMSPVEITTWKTKKLTVLSLLKIDTVSFIAQSQCASIELSSCIKFNVKTTLTGFWWRATTMAKNTETAEKHDVMRTLFDVLDHERRARTAFIISGCALGA